MSIKNKLFIIQDNFQTYDNLDLQHLIVGHGFQFKYKNITKIPKQIS
jgi:hypothetical protein